MRVFHHAVTSLLLALWLGVRIVRRRGLPPTPLNPVLYIGVCVWFASAFLSIDPRMALENLWFPITHLLLFFVMVDLIQSGREALLTETMLLLAALVVLLAGLQLASWYFGGGFATSTIGWSYVLTPEMPLPLVSPRLFVPLGVSTWLAAYTAPLVIFTAAWALSVRRRAARLPLLVLALLLLVVMLLSGSRGGWISLGVSGAVFVGLIVLQDARLQRTIRHFVLPLGIIVVAAGAATTFIFLRISAEPGHSTGDVLRFDLWRGALDVGASHPFLGVGPGLFGKAYRLIRDPLYVDNRLGTAHNFYLNTFAETGIVGVLVALALGTLLLRSWWQLWHTAETPARKTHLAGAFAALLGLAAQSFFDTFNTTPLVLLALSLTAYCITAPRSRIAPPLRGNRPAALASLLLVAVFAIGLFRSDQAHAAFNASLGGSLEQAQRAVALDPSLNLYHLQVAYLTDADTDLAQAIQQYETALQLEPTWDVGWVNLAALYLRDGRQTEALDALQRAVDIDFRNGALLLWAQVADATNSAPNNEIIGAYDRALRSGALESLPLSVYWSETERRQQVLNDYIADLSDETLYRVMETVDPTRLDALVPTNPANANEWWVVGEHVLTVENDPQAAFAAFSQAVALSPTTGDYYVARARARYSERDLNLAELLGTVYESPYAVRATDAGSVDEKIRLLAAAVPPRVIQQNFEGVLFAGRVASFDVLPEMRLPGPGHSLMQPWYEIADLYLAQNDTDGALSVYRAILDRAPDEQQAHDAMARLSEGGS